MRLPRRGLLLGTVAGILLATVVGGVPGVASASVGTARAQAAALRAEVDALTVEAEQATERYDAAQSALDALTTRRLLAHQRLEALSARSAAAGQIAENRVRALYMTGGSAGMLDSLLQSHTLDDMVDRSQIMSRIVGVDRSRVAGSDAAVRQAKQVDAELGTLTRHQTNLERRASTAARAVQSALAKRQRLLRAANATVRRLAAAQRRAEQRAAEQSFMTQLYTAQEAAAARRHGPGGVNIVGDSAEAGAPTAAAAEAIAAARTRLGMPYVWGATGPYAFDCSGLTGWSYKQAGVLLPRTASEQWYAGPHVDLADLEPGDLLFWATDTSDPATIHHVALYIGDGMMIAAPEPGDVVKVQPVYLTGYIGAVRPTA